MHESKHTLASKAGFAGEFTFQIENRSCPSVRQAVALNHHLSTIAKWSDCGSLLLEVSFVPLLSAFSKLCFARFHATWVGKNHVRSPINQEVKENTRMTLVVELNPV